MRHILAAANGALFALIAAAPPLALVGRRLPGVALACLFAALASIAVLAWARRRRLPLEITTLLLLPPAVAWGLGEGCGLFARLPLWDTLAHGVAGFSLGALGTAGAAAARHPTVRAPGLLALLGGLGLASLAGALWELGEWTSDRLLGTATLGSAGDTVADLAADLGGALLGASLTLAGARRLSPPRRDRLAHPFRTLLHPRAPAARARRQEPARR